jgi:hypothetical protein
VKTGRKCECCRHPNRKELDALLISGGSFRVVARRFGVARDSALRHLHNCLPALVAQSQEARMLADTDSLIAEMNRVHAYVHEVLEHGRVAGDDRLILMGVDSVRRNVDTLLRITQDAPLKQQIRELQQQIALRDALLANIRLATNADQQQPMLPIPPPDDIRFILRTLIEAGAAIDPARDGNMNALESEHRKETDDEATG